MLIPSKKIELGSLCNKMNCKLRCDENFDGAARTEIFKKFHSLDINSKNALLFKSLTIQPVQRHRKDIKKPVTYNRKVAPVYKSAMCAIYQISEKKYC